MRRVIKERKEKREQEEAARIAREKAQKNALRALLQEHARGAAAL